MNDATVTFTIQIKLPEYALISDVDAFKTKVKEALESYVFDILNDDQMLDPDISENTEAEVHATDKWAQQFAHQQILLKAKADEAKADAAKAEYTYRGEECDLCGKLTQVLSNDPDDSLVCCECQTEGARS